MIPHDLPSFPWQKVGMDLFQLEGHIYLIVADYYSKIPFVRRITSETSRCVIAKLKTLFSEHGIPDNVFSDGGPCFSSSEFAKFARCWGFTHTMSSPHYAQSNGLVERPIQTVKNVMGKAHSSGCDLEMAMLCARATPVDAKIGSPAELLYGRPIRTNLPVRTHQNEGIYNALKDRQDQQKWYYSRGSSDRPDLQVGQAVGLQDPHASGGPRQQSWRKAQSLGPMLCRRQMVQHTGENTDSSRSCDQGFKRKHRGRKVAGRCMRHHQIEETA